MEFLCGSGAGFRDVFRSVRSSSGEWPGCHRARGHEARSGDVAGDVHDQIRRLITEHTNRTRRTQPDRRTIRHRLTSSKVQRRRLRTRTPTRIQRQEPSSRRTNRHHIHHRSRSINRHTTTTTNQHRRRRTSSPTTRIALQPIDRGPSTCVPIQNMARPCAKSNDSQWGKLHPLHLPGDRVPSDPDPRRSRRRARCPC